VTSKVDALESRRFVVVLCMPGDGWKQLANELRASSLFDVSKFALSQLLRGCESFTRNFRGDTSELTALTSAVLAGLRQPLAAAQAHGESPRVRVIFDVEAWSLWPVVTRLLPEARYVLLTRNCRDAIVALIRENVFSCQENSLVNFRRAYPANTVVSSALLWEQRMEGMSALHEGSLASHEVIRHDSLADGRDSAISAILRLCESDIAAEEHPSHVSALKKVPAGERLAASERLERALREAIGPLSEYMPVDLYARLEQLNQKLGYGPLDPEPRDSVQRTAASLDFIQAKYPNLEITLS
jgi:hypothetical protein